MKSKFDFALLLAVFACAGIFAAEPKAENIAIKPAKTEAAENKDIVVILSTPDSARATILEDPAKEQALKMLLARQPDQKQKAAPFLRVSKPDPLEAERTMGLKSQPPDKDAPVNAMPSAPPPKLSK